MPADTRTLNWYENRDDTAAIKANNWRIQIAKLVAISPSSTPTYNIVWQSKGVAPSTAISWKVQYALGWTVDPPDTGMTVQITGEWQPCNLDESYNVDENGFWVVSDRTKHPKQELAPLPDWLNVGYIDYMSATSATRTPKSKASTFYEPIFIDPTTLPLGAAGQYKPHEMTSWWLGAGDLTGQVI
ncbi:hypothetical protein B0T26DRAFT_636455, partial [Lasiosphaeria miniovina]